MATSPNRIPASGFTYPTKLLIAFACGGSCAICKDPLRVTTEDGDTKHKGEAAHIAGEKPKAARYDPAMTNEQRNHHSNGIYACLDCHDKIDDREPHNYPTERLHQIKNDHEKTIEITVSRALSTVNFKELKLVCMRLLDFGSSGTSDNDFNLTAIEEKIKLNELGNRAKSYLTMGLSLEQQVQDFIEAESLADSQFAIKLRDGFRAEYYKQRTAGLRGDALYQSLLEMVSPLSATDFGAVIAVLAYLFEKCEVFERE